MSPDVRAGLLGEQRRTAARAAALRSDLEHVMAASTLVATDDEHDPEGATIAFDRAQLIAVLEQSQQHLADLERALARVDAGTYGTCDRCGEPIPAERLAARPAASTCVRCAAPARRP